MVKKKLIMCLDHFSSLSVYHKLKKKMKIRCELSFLELLLELLLILNNYP